MSMQSQIRVTIDPGNGPMMVVVMIQKAVRLELGGLSITLTPALTKWLGQTLIAAQEDQR